MQLVERTIIKKNHPNYKSLDTLAFLSKNLYNMANYIVRQEFINKGNYLDYNKVQKLLQSGADYQAIPAKVSQQVLIILDQNWQSFFQAIRAYNQCPSKFKSRPKLPKYKHKQKGRNILVYTKQAISKPQLVKNQKILLSKSELFFDSKINYDSLQQVRIIPKLNYYVIEVVYESIEVKLDLSESHVASVDLGVNNLATVTSNKKGFQPFIINGRPVKSINQFYNKKKGKLQSELNQNKSSNRIKKLSTKRNLKIDDYLHKTSRYIINHLIEHQIGILVIGNNPNWKQSLNLGPKNNQNFVQIPFFKLIEQLKYKAKLVGIKVIINEESYTSKASFLDWDDLPVYQKGVKHKFSGQRVKRGLYKASNGVKYNADVNGSLNILRKAVPNAFSNGIEGVVVHPIKVTLN
ncbi:MAG: IS200/IS605 family element transposase accessory protein TnpB [Okeania sp. SIO3I5]|uniref:RNA-guided endonuclease InsQ/TnpB family protein n=1 Tax=Okeania sp. SIO3I5 TaxID=2607805 RepID=UPI0013BC25E6|nr:transposase [Okeania sp. SIO3I5]NEQ35521.1 IS200/IS605 family element transposase accessory protein TnpB [Okeania sp. SIO3I5]